MQKPKSGEVKVFGGEPGTSTAFRKIGFAPEDGVPPEYLSSEEYLSFVAELKVADRAKRAEAVAELLRVFELSPRKRVREFSKGMKRRITLAQAFLGEPELLILDEPLNGLDPLIIIKLREMIERNVQRGAAIIYSSHILTEVEKSCSRILLLKAGECVYSDSTAAAVKEFGSVEAVFAARMGSGN
jgi:ABC-2 type transport system ATP-binding protein